MMKIIGTNYYGHDSALFYIDTEKKNIFAMSTERVTRIKHDDMDITPILEKYSFQDIDYFCHGYSSFDAPVSCDLRIDRMITLERNKAFRTLIKPKYITDLKVSRNKKYVKFFISFLRQPLSTIQNIKKLGLKYPHKTSNEVSPSDVREYIESYMRNILKQYNITHEKLDFFDHHLCHAAGAYYFSPFAFKHKAFSLTVDGWGDGVFSKLYIFEEDTYKQIGESGIALVNHSSGKIRVSSIGELYGNFTEALGLRRYSDEGKVEALAAFADKDDTLYDQLMAATKISIEGISYDVKALEPLYELDYLQKQIKIMGEKPFAATIQSYLEDVIVSYLNMIAEHYDVEHLCLSGGVAANIIMSLNIYERTKFKHIYVLPAMGDEGVALGSALLKAVEMKEDISWVNKLQMPYYGNAISQDEIKNAIEFYKDSIDTKDLGDNWYYDAARSIADDKIVAIVHGRMEFGPRALGNRSILANPVNPKTREHINLKVKKRPEYQPFCPSILEEERERLFEESFPHKHMAIAFRVKEEFHDQIPSAIHVDGTARPQFVEEKDNAAYYQLLKEVKKHTGFGVVINTSFNLHGRTIVHTAKDAILDFIDCNIDELYIEGYCITRKNSW
jgi:carbamoyltransferase